MPHISKTLAYYSLKLMLLPMSKLTRSEMENMIALAFDKEGVQKKEWLQILGKAITAFGGGVRNTIDTNGEKWLIENTGKLEFNTIFDVGANIGEWSKLAYAAHKQASIQSFEIVPETYVHLEKSIKEYEDRIHINNIGLLDQASEVDVYIGEDSEISSIYKDANSGGNSNDVISCKTMTGIDFVREKNIPNIDFMKIDTEGAESKVIKGFLDLFDQQKIRLVQFEYNRGAIMGRFLLADFYDFFVSRGYVVGKLTPTGVMFRDYDFSHEDFNGPNYVACLKEDKELIEAISIKNSV